MNVLFLGQKIIAERCLELIINKKYSDNFCLKVLVTDEDFYKNFIEKSDLTPFLISNKSRNEQIILEAIKMFNIDILISVQHPWILSSSILNAVNNFAFNLHNAKLPEYKGYNSISHSILNGDSEYTTTIHWISPVVDMGDIAFEKIVAINPDDTAYSLYYKTVNASVENFEIFLTELTSNSSLPKKQITSVGRFYKRYEIQNLKLINSIQDTEEVDKKTRAFYFPPFEPAYFILDGKKFYVSPKPY